MYLLSLRTVMGKMVTTLVDSNRGQSRHARLPITLLVLPLFVALSLAIGGIPFSWLMAMAANGSSLAVGFLVLGVTLAWCYWRTGRTKLAAIAIIGTLFVIPTYLNFAVYQTIYSPDVWVYFILIPLTGLFLGRRAMLYFALLCIATVTFLFVAGHGPALTFLRAGEASLNNLAILIVSLALNAVLVYLIIRRAEIKTEEAKESLQSLWATNSQLEKSRSALEEAHDQLELRVQERTSALQVANESLQCEMAARQQLVDALCQSEANWRSLVENAPELIATVATDGSILFVNRAVRGQPIEELVGGSISQLYGLEQHQQEIQRALAAVIETGKAVSYESSEEANGQRTWAINRLGPIYQGDGIVAVILISTDITEQKQSEMAMLHAQKLESLGVMAGGVAHDFNNLLAAIMGQTSLGLAKMMNDPAAAQAHLKNIRLTAERATDLTRQMLNYAGRGATDLHLLNLNQLLDDNIQILSASISKRIELIGMPAADLPFIMGDTGQIQQLLMNLILNAADAIGDVEGTIAISTKRYVLRPEALHEWKLVGGHFVPGDYVLLQITDTGCGMDSETLNRIFDPFFTTKFTGRGLGLASAIGIVRAHCGGLHVSSTLGVGTTFQILFPISTSSEANNLQSFETSTADRQESHNAVNHMSEVSQREEVDNMFGDPFVSYAGKKVLIIDDEDDVRQVTAEILEISDIETLQARNGNIGIELFRQHQHEIDLVLLDLSMPGMSGEEVVKQLWLIQPDVKITLLSGYDQQEVTRRLGNGSQLSFLQKPYSMELLLQEIGRQFSATTSAVLQPA